MRLGIEASYSHPENGMTERDVYACKRAADQLNEIIIFRSTGPWSKRWLEETPPYPSKNFHVKGKSSDWGPMAGFVPYDGSYSKVGHETERDEKGRTKAEKGTAAEFQIYCQAASRAGYYIPENWTWGMSIRDTNADVDR